MFRSLVLFRRYGSRRGIRAAIPGWANFFPFGPGANSRLASSREFGFRGGTKTLQGSSSTSSGVQPELGSKSRTGAAVSSYNSRASGAGPRRVPSASTRTTYRKPPCGTAIVSPMRIVWLAFPTATPLTATAPAAQRRAARDRLLARRANHNHWSSRRLADAAGPWAPLKRASAP